MDLIEQIKDNFNKGYFNRAMKISGLPDEYPAWTIKHNSWIGVAVPFDKPIAFVEHFSMAKIYVERNVLIENKNYDLLMLICYDMEYRNEFATICSQFVQPGADGTERRNLISSPETWWNNWKVLIGNAISNKQVYSTIGELIAVEYLLDHGFSPKWSGVEMGTHDIELDDCSYEVKSTIKRYGYEVTISSLYQLKKAGEHLNLVFCRFEESQLGRSLDDVVGSIIMKGYAADKLEPALTRAGFEKGCTARKKKYKLLEMKMFEVNDEFPKVTEESFKNDRVPENIIKFTYTVDLSGVHGENLL